MRENYSEWIENWQREVDQLFRQLQAIPPELVDDVAQLAVWNEQAKQVSAEILAIRERLRQKRLERQAIQARIEAIAERQRIATEIELEEKRLAKWRIKIEQIKAYIDRVTDKILAELRERQREAEHQAALLNEQQRRQAAEDMRVWSAFQASLSMPAPKLQPDSDDLQAAEHARQEQARLRREYQALRERPHPTAEENQAAWEEFAQELENPDKAKRSRNQ